MNWPKKPVWIALETVVITAAAVAISYWIKPQNPLLMNSIFPWLWLAPILLVLRYGFGAGLLSAALIGVVTIVHGSPGAILLPNYQQYLVSCFGVTLFCGLISSSASNRYVKAEELLNYTQDKLQDLSRSYYLLYISHNTLEKNLISQAITPHGIMEKLKRILINQQGVLTPELAYQFLQLICQQCSASVAGIYQGKSGQFAVVSEMGDMGSIMQQDPVLLNALKNKETAFVRSDSPKNTYLIVTPMQSMDDKIDALLIIKEMPFNCLNVDNLRLLNILVNYFIESFNCTQQTSDLLNQYADCPPAFLQELSQLLRLKIKLKIDSALAVLIIDKSLRPYNVVDNLMQRQRTLDAAWLRETEQQDILITLMPFTQAAGINGYFERVNRYLKSSTGLEIDQQKIKTRSIQLLAKTPAEMMPMLMDMIEEAKHS